MGSLPLIKKQRFSSLRPLIPHQSLQILILSLSPRVFRVAWSSNEKVLLTNSLQMLTSSHSSHSVQLEKKYQPFKNRLTKRWQRWKTESLNQPIISLRFLRKMFIQVRNLFPRKVGIKQLKRKKPLLQKQIIILEVIWESPYRRWESIRRAPRLQREKLVRVRPCKFRAWRKLIITLAPKVRQRSFLPKSLIVAAVSPLMSLIVFSKIHSLRCPYRGEKLGCKAWISQLIQFPIIMINLLIKVPRPIEPIEWVKLRVLWEWKRQGQRSKSQSNTRLIWDRRGIRAHRKLIPPLRL